MIKISYPEPLNDFHSDYSALFKTETSIAFRDFMLANGPESLKTLELSVILLADFKQLCDWSFEMNDHLACTENCAHESCQGKPLREELKEILNYDSQVLGKPSFKHSLLITGFFKQYCEKLGVSTCYFCNIHYVYGFESRGEYLDVVQFVNEAPEEEIRDLRGIGPKGISQILQSRGSVRNLSELNVDIRFERALHVGFQTTAKIKKQFTLDHVLDKASHPLAALSLYNLVPSCYSCNSQFKGSKEIVARREHYTMSPTSKDFEMQERFHFGLFYNTLRPEYIRSSSDFRVLPIFIDPSGNAVKRNFLKVFELMSRYRVHKDKALEIVQKKRKYSPAKLGKMSKLLNISEVEIKEDIFGRELIHGALQAVPFTKFKRDIFGNVFRM